MRFLRSAAYLPIPLAFVVHYWIAQGRPWEPTATFVVAGVAVIPLARLMGEATGHLAERAGPTWGGLLNATFGNAAELIIGAIALSKGLNDVVKASLTGSILGNLLLVSGCAMLVGGWKRDRQTYSRGAAEANAGLLTVAVAAMLFPAIFHFSFRYQDVHLVEHENRVSVATSIVLMLVYGLGLLFTLKTHRHIFSSTPATGPEEPPGLGGIDTGWSVRWSVIALLLASVGVAAVSELLVGSAEQMAQHLHWNRIFVGVILLALLGNAAEHSTAILLARRNDMDTAMTITYQSSLQIALFATPLLVLLSAVMVEAGVGKTTRLDLVFSPMEVAAVLLTVGIVVVLGMNGETNWFEGVLLLAVYAILGITFFYIPSTRGGGYDSESATVPGASVVSGEHAR